MNTLNLLRVIACTCVVLSGIVCTALAQSDPSTAAAEHSTAWFDGGRLTVKAGLSQPVLLNGANVAVTYKTDRLTFEYSHGMWLDYDRVGRTDVERDQNLDLYSPWTTGFGVGYRLPWRFDLRVEVKAHRYRVTPPGDAAFRYTTVSIGPALNYHQPLYKGLGLDATLRFWPNVASTLNNDRHVFTGSDGNRHIHEAHDLGVFPNVSVGYTF